MVMFEQSRDDTCEWRKKLNMREEKIKGMNKKMDDSKKSTEPLKEELSKNTQEQIISDNNKK